MKLQGKVVVITGAAHGIGRAMAVRFAREQPEALVLIDRNAEGVERVARLLQAQGHEIAVIIEDVGSFEAMQRIVEQVEGDYGRVDLFCNNAGLAIEGDEATDDAQWQLAWDVNVMTHVWSARAALPGMLARRGGAFLNTASAAGLLTMIGAAPYAVSKHAAVAFAEWLAITHADDHIKVFCLCPQGVHTPMLEKLAGTHVGAMLTANALTAESVADACVQGMARDQFLILPHAEVAEYVTLKATNHESWLHGMRRLNAKLMGHVQHQEELRRTAEQEALSREE